MFNIGNCTIKIINDEYAVVRNNLTKKYIKLGFSETKYLLLKLEVEFDCEMNNDMLPIFQAGDLSNENKIFLTKKFEEWGFIGESLQKNKKSSLYNGSNGCYM